MVNEGTADPRIATVVRLLDCYRTGDLEGMQNCMQVGVTLEAHGENPLAGTYEGLGGVLAFIAKSMGVFVPGSVDIKQVEARGDEVQVHVAGDMALLDGRTESILIRQRYWFTTEAKVARIEAEAAENQEQFDRLLREQARGV